MKCFCRIPSDFHKDVLLPIESAPGQLCSGGQGFASLQTFGACARKDAGAVCQGQQVPGLCLPIHRVRSLYTLYFHVQFVQSVHRSEVRCFIRDSSARLPVIADNCPACFAAPKERHRRLAMLLLWLFPIQKGPTILDDPDSPDMADVNPEAERLAMCSWMSLACR